MREFTPGIQKVPVDLELLDEIEDFLDDHADVKDGSYGAPRPNRAMQLLSMLKAARLA